MKSRFDHEATISTTTVDDQVLNHCFLQKDTTKGLIHLKAFQVKADSFSFSVISERIFEIRHDNLHGHKIMTPFLLPYPIRKLEYTIPKQYLVSQETCLDHVIIILSEMNLPSLVQKHLVSYISKESVKYGGGRGGFKVKFDVKVNVDRWVRILCRSNKKDDRCRFREILMAKKLTAMECPICLTELSSVVSRMELLCSHVFHRDCVKKWLEKNPSCPTCRTKTLGGYVSIY